MDDDDHQNFAFLDFVDSTTVLYFWIQVPPSDWAVLTFVLFFFVEATQKSCCIVASGVPHMFCMVATLQYQSCLHTVTLWGQDPNFGLLQLLYRWAAANSEHRFGKQRRILGLGGPSKSCADKKPQKSRHSNPKVPYA